VRILYLYREDAKDFANLIFATLRAWADALGTAVAVEY
jgi:hypothetical protein